MCRTKPHPSITQMIFVRAGNNCKEHSAIQYENSILENFNNNLEFLDLNNLFWSLQYDQKKFQNLHNLQRDFLLQSTKSPLFSSVKLYYAQNSKNSLLLSRRKKQIKSCRKKKLRKIGKTNSFSHKTQQINLGVNYSCWLTCATTLTSIHLTDALPQRKVFPLPTHVLHMIPIQHN